MQYSSIILSVLVASAWARVSEVHVIKRAITYASTCTYYNTVTLGGNAIATTSLYSSSCTGPAVSGPYVTVNCYTGLLVLCSPGVTATSCAPSTTTKTSTTFLAGTGTTTIITSTCSNAIYPPNPLQPAAGTVCYADNPGGPRVLNGASTTSNTMTNAFCKTYCNNLGFSYSGTEYGAECYCGNTLPTVSSSNCNMACSTPGSTEICGGPYALSVSTNSALVASNAAASALLASWTSEGCYSDNYPASRILPSSSSISNSMTLENCVTFCNSGGYVLAGVENASECYCANTLQSDGATYGISGQTGCTYQCAGNSAEICGGADVLNLYSKFPVVPVAPPPAPVPTTAGGYTYIGCYIDQNGGRTLGNNKSYVTSVEACVAACSAAGFKYAGVEYRAECWCDNAIRYGATTIAAKNCLLPCTGTPSETCGGSNAIQIYLGTSSAVTVPLTASGYTYVDSYIDSPSARVLPVQLTLSSYSVTTCVRACSNNNYAYAGVEFGSQCFCGTARLNNPTGGQTPNIACTGNSAQFCGGANILQVYTGTPSPQLLTTPFTNGQCVADNTNNMRTLSAFMASQSNMTPAVCRSLCTSYTYYGVEYSSECWCGNSFPSGTVLSSSCTMPCSGDNTQTCGGSYALNMYNS